MNSITYHGYKMFTRMLVFKWHTPIEYNWKKRKRYKINDMGTGKAQTAHTWCRAVSPSAFAALMSAAKYNKLFTSFLSPDETDARKAQSMGKETALMFLRTGDSRLVSDSSHRFNCSALLNRADIAMSKFLRPKPSAAT